VPLAIGWIEALFRYPVKSMGGERVEAAELGWHGLPGDRRLAFRRLEDRGGFPWLTATTLPDLLRFSPCRRTDEARLSGRDPDVRRFRPNYDPDSARPAPEILKAVVRANGNHAGVYATVIRPGRLAVGQGVVLHGPGGRTK
jgi:uncharacterized protein YcbX